MQQREVIEISESIIGEKISNYQNDKFILIDSTTCFKYGVHYRFNEILENAEQDFSFLGNRIKKVAFNNDNGIIKDIVIFIETSEIDNFYKQLEDKYGKPESARISSSFLKEKGYLKPTEIDSSKADSYYKDVPTPSLIDYKNLNGVSWYDVKSKLHENVDVNLHVLSFKNKTLGFAGVYNVKLVFRVFKL